MQNCYSSRFVYVGKMAIPPRRRTHQHEQRRRDAGLVKLARWIRREDLADALAALEPFTARAALDPLRPGRPPRPAKITGFVFGSALSGKENLALRELGLIYDRGLGRWIIPGNVTIKPDLLKALASEASEVLREPPVAR